MWRFQRRESERKPIGIVIDELPRTGLERNMLDDDSASERGVWCAQEESGDVKSPRESELMSTKRRGGQSKELSRPTNMG